MTRIELADAMLRGASTDGVIEDKQNYISGTSLNWCFACALGCALIGKLDGDYHKAKQALKNAADNSANEYEAFGNLLGVSSDLAIEIEHKHLNNWSIEQIAAWLKSEEVEVKTI